ncbi:MAG TPA: hypothetical protein V6C46_05830 [Coleofasciculaceae cyanobacterium]
MDQQLIQQLMQIFQQGLQVLQSAGGAQDQGMDDGDMDYGGDDDDMDEDNSPPMGGDDDDDMDYGDDDDEPMPARKTLNERVKMLENHTGLMKKSAGATLATRLDDLEDAILGEQYDGSPLLRVRQLEKAAGLYKSASHPAKSDDAPDVIDLGDLIKSAIHQGIQEGLAKSETTVSPEGRPSPGDMRKAARNGAHYGSRKAQRTTVSTDEDLSKAAQRFGYSEDELDKPVGLGDLLLMEWTANKAGQSVFNDDDE